MTPPEMTNGSSSGSDRSNSSMACSLTWAPSPCAWQTLEKVQLVLAALELPGALHLEHARYQAVGGIEEKRMQRARRARACVGGILSQRDLKEGVKLHALASRLGVFEDHPPRADVARPRECRAGGGRAASTRRLRSLKS